VLGIYAVIAFIALDRAEFVEAFPGGFSIVGMWVAFVTVVLAALSLPVALG